MPDWRERVLAPFTADASTVWIACDPDGLMLDERVADVIHQRGFDLLVLDDPVVFRLAYATRNPAHPLIIQVQDGDAKEVPFDAWRIARPISLSVGALFPTLDPNVLATLDPADLDQLDTVSSVALQKALGENETRDLLIRALLRDDPSLAASPESFLSLLLKLHARARPLPATLLRRLVNVLQSHSVYATWSIDALVADRVAFMTFLQERWPRFVESRLGRPIQYLAVRDASAPFAISGPNDLPFGDPSVYPLVDTLFLNGSLAPVPYLGADLASDLAPSDTWILTGLHRDEAAERRWRLEHLRATVESSLPSATDRHDAWLQFAPLWAEMLALVFAEMTPARPDLAALSAIESRLDATFQEWLINRYGGLYSQAGTTPAMLHRVPHLLARALQERSAAKVALIVVDGLSLDQWVAIRQVLVRQVPALNPRTGAVFAWIPTITSVSRQALFAGKLPLQFPKSIAGTAQEPTLWRQFWQGEGLQPAEIGYAKGLGLPGSESVLDELLPHPRLRALGIVVNSVDEIMHGQHLGTAGMHAAIRQWADGGFLAVLLERLTGAGFQVTLTSDHGNVECLGAGKPQQGGLAATRGERVQIYTDPLLRSTVQARFPSARIWSDVGLPDGFHPLIATGRSAFTPIGERRVSHGGLTLEEVIVPLIQFGAVSE